MSLFLPLDLKPCQTNRLAIVNNNNNNNKDDNDVEQQHQHLTQFERDGLQTLCSFLRKLKDKSIPEDLIQTSELLQTMEVRSLVRSSARLSCSFDPLASSY